MINASLLAISNMFTESIRSEQSGSLPLRPDVTSDTKPFSLNLANNLERPTTDNNITNNAKSNPTSNQSPDFSGTFCTRAALQTPNEGPPRSCLRQEDAGGTQSEDKIKAETKDSIRQKRNSAENPAPAPVFRQEDVGASAQESPTTNAARQRRGGFAAEINPRLLAKAKARAGQQQKEGETAANLAQLMNNSFLNKLTPFLHSNAGVSNAADKQQQGGTPLRGNPAKTAGRVCFVHHRTNDGHNPSYSKVGAADSQTGEKSAHPGQTDATAGSAGQKTAILNYSFPPVLRKSPDPPLGGPERTHCKTPLEPLDSNKAKSSDNPGLNVTRLQTCLPTVKISTGQNKACGELVEFNGGSSLPKAGRFSTAASIESTAGGASSIEFERSSILTQNANIAKGSREAGSHTRLLQDVSKDISEQIIESIQTFLRQADKQITIRLNPPELGQVFVRFQEREAEITGLLEVSKAEIRYEIEQALPQIIRTLADYGVAIKRLDVLLIDQPESAQGGPGAESFEQGGSGNPPWVRQRWSEAVTDTYSYEDFGEPAQRRAEGPLWRITNGGINVLI